MTTIYALASGSLPSAIAIIRISGPQTPFILRQLCGKIPKNRVATLLEIKTLDKQRIDEGLVLFFAAPKSFTGEDCAELHVHGGIMVVEMIFQELSKIRDVSPAKAGEFSLRAVHNGKFDLTMVEGYADLVASKTKAQLTQANFLSTGGLSKILDGLYAALLEPLALCEALIDFSEDNSLEIQDYCENVRTLTHSAHEQLKDVLQPNKLKPWFQNGFCVVIAGAPNVGKSTLFNALVNDDKSIISPYPGTTRDSIEAFTAFGGYPMRLVDTAGIRNTDDPVEAEGIVRAKNWLKKADLVVWLEQDGQASLDERARLGLALEKTLVVYHHNALQAGKTSPLDKASVIVDTNSASDIMALKAKIVDFAAKEDFAKENFIITHQRHVDELTVCQEYICTAFAELSHGMKKIDLVAENLRQAIEKIGNILRPHNSETLLDTIFTKFCIGK